MPSILTLFAMRGGTGKTALAANLAVTMAQQGLRTALVDLDLPAPGLHAIFGLRAGTFTHGTNCVLKKVCSLEEGFVDVTDHLSDPVSGSVLLLPGTPVHASLKSSYTLDQAASLYADLQRWAKDQSIDLILMDVQPGLAENMLFWLACADTLLLTMRLSQQDYQDTALLVEVARKLSVSRLGIVVNQVPALFSAGVVKSQIEQAYAVEVMAVLPQSNEFLAGSGPASTRFSDHPLTRQYLQIVESLRKNP